MANMNPHNATLRRFGNEPFMEEEDLENKLINKTSKLKQITIQLGDEIRGSNKFLKGLDEDFEKSSGFLAATMAQLNKLPKYANCKLYFYLILFSMFVFFVLYLVIKIYG